MKIYMHIIVGYLSALLGIIFLTFVYVGVNHYRDKLKAKK